MLDPREISNEDEFTTELNRLFKKSRLSGREVARRLARRLNDVPKSSTVATWLQGEHLPAAGLAPAFYEMLDVLGVAEEDDRDAWLDALGRVRVPPGPRAQGSPAPYRGLFAYEPEHAAMFAGRDGLVAELAAHVRQHAASGQITVVVGPSGSGKSSLVRAGLIPEFTQATEARYAIMVPDQDPLEQFAVALRGQGTDVDEQAVPPAALIVVDQFEQLFVTCHDRQQQTAFVDALIDAAGTTAGAPAATIVVVLRSDFYTQALELPGLVEALQNSQFVVGQMSQDELRQAVTVPARRAGIALQPGLVDVILRDLTPLPARTAKDAAHEPGTLPLLSHALEQTWKNAKGRTLTVEHYRNSGGISGAVAQTAGETYEALGTVRRKELARQAMLRLVQVSDDQPVTRRKVAWTEILDMESAEPQQWRSVLDRFIDARLLTADEEHVEIAHEALLTAWPKLTEWLAADHEWRRAHQQLRAAAAHWVESGRGTDNLYRGRQLRSTEEFISDRGFGAELSRLEREFVDASIGHRLHEESASRRQTRRRYLTTSLAVVLALVVIGGAVIVRIQQDAADLQREAAAIDEAQALSRLIADKADRLRGRDPALAGQLALAAYRTSQTPEARSSLLNSTSVPTGRRWRPDNGKAKSLAVSPAGQVAAGTDKGEVQLWSVSKDSDPADVTILRGASGSLVKVAYSPDGRHLAAAARKGALAVWDTTAPSKPSIDLGNLPSEPTSLAWSRDGQGLFAAAGSEVRYVYLDQRPSPGVKMRAGSSTINMIAVSPDGQTLAVGSADSNVYLWRISDPLQPVLAATLTEPSSKIFALGFSPDGTTLAAGTAAEHAVYTWDLRSSPPRAIGKPLTGPASWINYVSFSPDGTTLTAASSDSKLWTYDLRSRQPVDVLPHPSPLITASFTHPDHVVTLATDGVLRGWRLPGSIIKGANDAIWALSFDASGTKLAVGAGAADNSASVWNLTQPHHPRLDRPRLVNRADTAKLSGSGVISPDGNWFAAGTVAGDIAMWNIAAPTAAKPAKHVAESQIEFISVNSDGNRIAISTDDGTVEIVDLSPQADATVRATLRAPQPGLIYHASFNPEGRLVAAASINSSIYLWSIENPGTPALLATLHGSTSSALSAVFSPDGKILAVGSADGTVRLWDVTNPQNPTPIGQPLAGPVGYVYALSFRPGTRTLAAASTDSTLWLWNLDDASRPEHLATLTGSDQGILAVAFSPRSDLVAAGGDDRSVRLWRTDSSSAEQWICSTAGDRLTQEEWSRYVPERTFADPCSDLHRQ